MDYVANNWFNIAVTISAAASAIIAYLTFTDSRRGAEIALLVESPIDVFARIGIDQQHANQTLQFDLKLIFSNTGPRGGAVFEFVVKLREPPIVYETLRGTTNVKDIIRNHVMVTGRKDEQPYDASLIALPVGGGGTVPLVAKVVLILESANPVSGPPNSSFAAILEKYRELTISIEYVVSASKGKIVRKEAEIRVIPHLKDKPPQIGVP